MHIQTTIRQQCLIVQPEGRFDAISIQDEKILIDDLLARMNKGLILDLRSIEFIDSAGLGFIVELFKKALINGKFALIGLSEKSDSLIRLSRLDKVIKIFPDEAAAIAYILK